MIKFLIKLCFGEAIRKRNAARKHNANVLQELLDREHSIKKDINIEDNGVFTTANALKVARRRGYTTYSSSKALREANFQPEV